MLLKYHLPRLDTLLKDVAITDLLAKAYAKLLTKAGQDQARESICRFVSEACWLCAPKLNAVQLAKLNDITDRSSQAKKLRSIAKATKRLANNIAPLLPSFGHKGSIEHFQDLLNQGVLNGVDVNNRGTWQSAFKRTSQPTIADLLNCFSKEADARAQVIQTHIAASRQKGGARAALYFAIDTLTTHSIQLSLVTPSEPHFPLVTAVIESLMPNGDSIDTGTIRRRYEAKLSRKTRA